MEITKKNNLTILTATAGYEVQSKKDKTVSYKVYILSDSENISDFIEIKSEMLNQEIDTYDSVINIDSFEDTDYVSYQQKLIKLSKEKLQFLLSQKAVLFNGKYYSITQEAQSHLDSLIAAAEDAEMLNISFTPMWNDIYGMREEWQLKDLRALRILIQQTVLNYVIQQQSIEQEILSIQDINALQNYSINFF